MLAFIFYGKDKLDYKNLLHNNEYIIAKLKKNEMKEIHKYTHTFCAPYGTFFCKEWRKRLPYCVSLHSLVAGKGLVWFLREGGHFVGGGDFLFILFLLSILIWFLK